MAIDGIGSSTSTNTSITGSRSGIADNFDTFLQLLTTQLRNQNPLDPLDTNAFTQQLVQFSSVEQQLKTNEFLSALVQANANSVNTNAVNYIGKTISASGTARCIASVTMPVPAAVSRIRRGLSLATRRATSSA